MAKPARILFVSSSSAISGAERSLACLLRRLDTARFELHLALPADSPLRDLVIPGPVQFHDAPPLHLRRSRPLNSVNQLRVFRKAFRPIVETVQPDIIHANTTFAALGAASSARKGCIPLIWHARDTVRLGMVGRSLARKCAAAIAISQTVQHSLSMVFDDPRQVHVIPNGIAGEDVQVKKTPLQTRRQLGLSEKVPLVAAVGQLIPWKRFDRLIALVPRIIAKRPKTVFVFVGADLFNNKSRHPRRLIRLAEDLGVAENIRFLGYRDDAADIIAAADAFLSASRNEPLGRAVMEAMWLGTPVAISREGGHMELIEEDVSGLAFDADNEKEGADKVLNLLIDRRYARKLAQAARVRVRKLFSVERMTTAIEDLYDELMGK